jgi:hypothetical protein
MIKALRAKVLANGNVELAFKLKSQEWYGAIQLNRAYFSDDFDEAMGDLLARQLEAVVNNLLKGPNPEPPR